MSVIIAANEKPSIDFAPATVVDEVVQNVRTILSTIQYEIPLDRAFGIDGSAVDQPMPQAKALLTTNIIQQVQRYEPRAVIEKITFDGGLDGRLTPMVEVTINETE